MVRKRCRPPLAPTRDAEVSLRPAIVLVAEEDQCRQTDEPIGRALHIAQDAPAQQRLHRPPVGQARAVCFEWPVVRSNLARRQLAVHAVMTEVPQCCIAGDVGQPVQRRADKAEHAPGGRVRIQSPAEGIDDDQTRQAVGYVRRSIQPDWTALRMTEEDRIIEIADAHELLDHTRMFLSGEAEVRGGLGESEAW